MKIYFSGSIRGGREHAKWYEFIVNEIKKYGEVLTEFVADQSLTSYGVEDLSEEQIYKRDIQFIVESDVVIADVTVPSLGVGYELAYAEKLNKKIFCLYRETEGRTISAMIAGNNNFKVFSYTKEDDISRFLESIFADLKRGDVPV